MRKFTFVILSFSLACAAACAQGVNPPVVSPQQNPPANPPVANSIPSPIAPQPSLYGGRWEVFVGGSMQFARATRANDVAVNTANVGGGEAALRLHINDWSAVELRYSIAWPVQTYGFSQTVHSRSSQIDFDYVLTLPTENRFKPFLEGGLGTIGYTPVGANPPGTVGERRTAVNYGGGFNVGLSGHLDLRLEYRGVIFHIPDFGGIRITNWNHMAVPDAGLVWHF